MKRLDYFDVENLRFALEQFAKMSGRNLLDECEPVPYKLNWLNHLGLLIPHCSWLSNDFLCNRLASVFEFVVVKEGVVLTSVKNFVYFNFDRYYGQ